jgi:hypothetical protein
MLIQILAIVFWIALERDGQHIRCALDSRV